MHDAIVGAVATAVAKGVGRNANAVSVTLVSRQLHIIPLHHGVRDLPLPMTMVFMHHNAKSETNLSTRSETPVPLWSAISAVYLAHLPCVLTFHIPDL